MTEVETNEVLEDTEASVEPVETPDETQQLWAKVAPDLADSVKELSPEAQTEILLKRLAVMQREDATATDEVPREASAGKSQESAQPPVGEIPALDPHQTIDRIVKAFEDGDSDVLRDAMGNWLGWVGAVVNTASAAVSETKGELADVRKTLQGVTRPSELRSVMPQVRGATEGDIPAAMKLLESGDATTPIAAMKLATFNRKEEIAMAQGTRSVSEEASRKAKGLAANMQRGGSRKPGTTQSAHLTERLDSPEGLGLIEQVLEERAKEK